MNEIELQQREAQKGCGMVVVVASFVVVSLFLVPTRFLGTNMVPEFCAVLMILTAFQVAAKRTSDSRIRLAREPYRTKDYDTVIRLLEPFTGRVLLWPNARFDRTGEALVMLADAWKNTGELAKARALVAYIQKYRKGEYVERCKQLGL